MVTCEIKHGNYFKIILFRMSPRHYVWKKIISKLFRPSSTSDWSPFISARGNSPEIISQLFQRIIAARQYFPTRLNNFSGRNNFVSVSDAVTCEIKHWSNFDIISKYFFNCNHSLMYVAQSHSAAYVPPYRPCNAGDSRPRGVPKVLSTVQSNNSMHHY